MSEKIPPKPGQQVERAKNKQDKCLSQIVETITDGIITLALLGACFFLANKIIVALFNKWLCSA